MKRTDRRYVELAGSAETVPCEAWPKNLRDALPTMTRGGYAVLHGSKWELNNSLIQDLVAEAALLGIRDAP
jgi:hypothetical protein